VSEGIEVITQTEFYRRFDEYLKTQKYSGYDSEKEKIIWYMSHLTKFVKKLEDEGTTYGPDLNEN
jgi:hypothetical protein